MDGKQIEAYYGNLVSRHFGQNSYRVQAEFYSTRGLRHEIRLQGRTIHFKIAEAFRTVPLYIHSILALILLGKLFRLRLPAELRKEYRDYVRRSFPEQASVKHRDAAKSYSPEGSVFNLQEIFDHVNQRFFNNQLTPPVIGWSKTKAYTRLGFYDANRNLLVISKIFDNKKVPVEVVRYLMYHEMLHIAVPARKSRSGRRTIHSREFKELERRFPDYETVTRWIAKRRHRL